MAPGPRILIKGRPELDDEEEVQDSDDEDTPTRYYTSAKVLGTLYRAIDETAFLKEVQSDVHQSRSAKNVDEGSVVQGVWEYLNREIPLHYDWERYIPDAEALKDMYDPHPTSSSPKTPFPVIRLSCFLFIDMRRTSSL